MVGLGTLESRACEWGPLHKDYEYTELHVHIMFENMTVTEEWQATGRRLCAMKTC